LEDLKDLMSVSKLVGQLVGMMAEKTEYHWVGKLARWLDVKLVASLVWMMVDQ
jgi:hypothetical protein